MSFLQVHHAKTRSTRSRLGWFTNSGTFSLNAALDKEMDVSAEKDSCLCNFFDKKIITTKNLKFNDVELRVRVRYFLYTAVL